MINLIKCREEEKKKRFINGDTKTEENATTAHETEKCDMQNCTIC